MPNYNTMRAAHDAGYDTATTAALEAENAPLADAPADDADPDGPTVAEQLEQNQERNALTPHTKSAEANYATRTNIVRDGG